jgi:hypothetical protein
MNTTRLSAATCLGVALFLGCGAPSEAQLYLTADKTTFDGRTEHVVLRVQAVGADSKPGLGVVSLATPAGSFVEGVDVTLTDGFATVTFTCDPAVDSACSGSMRLSASWAGQTAGVTLKVTPSVKVQPLAWRVVSTNTLATLFAVAQTSDHVVWAVGAGGTVLRFDAAQGQWSDVPSGVTTNLNAIAVTAEDELVVAGDRGTLLIFRAGAFTTIDTSIVVQGQDLSAVSAASVDDIDFASTAGHVFHFNGLTSTDEFALTSPVFALVKNDTVLWASGEGVLGRKKPGFEWVKETAPVLARLTVAASSADGLWLGGTRMDTGAGVLLLGPTDWRTTVIAEPLTAVAFPPNSDERFAITETQVYRQLGSGGWVNAGAPIGGRAAISRAGTDLVIVGPPGISLFRVP